MTRRFTPGHPPARACPHRLTRRSGRIADRSGRNHRPIPLPPLGIPNAPDPRYRDRKSRPSYPCEASMVMGTAAEFDIAEVVDRDFNVVARLAKPVLSGVMIRP